MSPNTCRIIQSLRVLLTKIKQGRVEKIQVHCPPENLSFILLIHKIKSIAQVTLTLLLK